MDIHGDAELEETLDSLQKWFEDNKNLPKKIERILLARFYYCMHKDVEKTKKLIELNYSLRNSYAYLFLDRDPADEASKNMYSYLDIVPLPGLTPENYKICIGHLRNTDPNLVNYTADAKAHIMIGDTRFSLPDTIINDVPLLSKGEIHVSDLEGYTMKHATHTSFRIFRVLMKFFQEAYPVRIKAVHIINSPSYMNKIMSFIRPFMKKEVYDLLHFHSNGLESLYDYVPKEMLPEEYGGQAGKLLDLKEQFIECIMERRDYIMDPDNWRIQKS